MATCLPIINSSKLLTPNTKRWLTLPNSLTKHLEHRLNKTILIKDCYQAWMKPNRLEKQLSVNLDNRRSAEQKIPGFCREVILTTGTEDWVLARVFIPKNQIKSLKWLQDERKQPIGRQLYKEKTTTRSLIYLDHLAHCTAKYEWLFSFFPETTPSLNSKLEHSMMRVSLVKYRLSEFLITEVYLKDLLNRLKKSNRVYWHRRNQLSQKAS